MLCRVLGVLDLTCPGGHSFRSSVEYHYSEKRRYFQTTFAEGEYIEPFDRPARTVLPACPTCGTLCAYDDEGELELSRGPRQANAQIGSDQVVTVAIHPQTGQIETTMRPDGSVPPQFAAAGFQPVQFRSVRSYERMCNELRRQTGKLIISDWEAGRDVDEIYAPQRAAHEARVREAARANAAEYREAQRRGLR